MSLLNREFNFPRKSHRVNIPLLVQVDGSVYKTSDWSMTGVGIIGLDREMEVGTRFAARLILPLAGGSLQLDVDLVCRNRRADITGCEFANLSNRNRRVLRHFIELAMEGRLDNLEDLAADLSAPDIESPLETALSLSEEEELSLLAKFRSRASMALVLGILFALFLTFTLWYNLVYMYKTVGVVSGSFLNVSSGRAGIVRSVLHHAGDMVHPGDILYELADFSLEEELLAKRELLAGVRSELHSLPPVEENAALLEALQQELEWKTEEYRSARRLHEQGVISGKDFEFVRNAWSRARINVLRQQADADARRRGLAGMRRELEARAQALQVEVAGLQRRQEHLRIRSPAVARVYAVAFQAGEYVDPGEVVMVLSRTDAPTVLFKMPSTQAARVTLGTPVRFFSYATDTSYVGRVSAIGYKAVNPQVGVMQEVSLDETVIRVSLPGPVPELPVNSRVRVWVRKRFAWPRLARDVLRNGFRDSRGEGQP
ncbi:HlyD family efflux transporter periplasmic adaptor subunit [Thermodesulfobacteriota bacterium B35]